MALCCCWNTVKEAVKITVKSNFRVTKAEYTSIQQWWDIGMVKVKQFCLQHTLNVSKDKARSMKTLERGGADSTLG